MVANILKYKSINLIMLYYCVYSRLSDIVEIAIQNSMWLIRNTGFGSQVDWNRM